MTREPSRRTFAAGAIGLGLAANAGRARATEPDAMSIGAASAPLQLVEFASATCPHCAAFHATNWTNLKTNYIDTGRVRLTMQEMLTPPATVSFGMFQLARCGGAEAPEYFRRLGILFERQHAILATGTIGGVRDALIAAGGEWGLTSEQVMASLSDQAGSDRIMRSIGVADSFGITATPAFILNGQHVDGAFQTAEGMTRILDAALAG